MKFSENWLREWVNPDIDSEALALQLTMLGLEVDGVEPAADFSESVIVAEIVAAEPHPDADKLQVCQVSTGADTVQIVCGAPNARVGLKTALAQIGTVMPGGDFTIKAAKLRGVASQGMLCSSKELGLGEANEGILELAADAPVGRPLLDYFQARDQLIEIDLTPNRGDCASIRGIAYDVAARNLCALTPPVIDPVTPRHGQSLPVEIEPGAGCPRYLACIIQGIDPQAKSPLWLVERLRRSGIRPISPVVDVTNYVMLELGQPMHGFDLAKLDGTISVRQAKANESLVLLDGREVSLLEDTLLIADDKGPLAIAGVMGGEASGVSDQTVDVLLESALFLPAAILGRPRHYNAHTDSGYRYERGVDPALQAQALARAAALLVGICGGEHGPVFGAEQPELLPTKEPIRLRRARVQRLLGVSLTDETILAVLEALGMREVESIDEGWLVLPPTRRYDLNREEDLIEELARIEGYDKLPRKYSLNIEQMSKAAEDHLSLNTVAEALVGRGYQEVVTYSFVDEKIQAALDPEAKALRLANPISEDLSVMRTSLWPGLVLAAQRNVNRQQGRMRLFETGLRFLPSADGALEQRPSLAGLAIGGVFDENWRSEQMQDVDFYAIKADLESILGLTDLSISFTAETHPALHPGRSASLNCVGKSIGWLGELHPKLQSELDLPRSIVFEIEASVFDRPKPVSFKPVSKYPRVRRDLALVIESSVSFQALKAAVVEVAPAYLQDVLVFDVYTGTGVQTGFKSVALGLILQDAQRTLSEQDIEQCVSGVLDHLQKKHKATLRE